MCPLMLDIVLSKPTTFCLNKVVVFICIYVLYETIVKGGHELATLIRKLLDHRCWFDENSCLDSVSKMDMVIGSSSVCFDLQVAADVGFT